MNPAHKVSRFSRDVAGATSVKNAKAPHCAYCGETDGELRSMKVRNGRTNGYTRVDVCGECRVTKLGFTPERTKEVI